MKKKFYVTTPIYYITAAPHIGTLYSTVIADALKRYHQLSGRETFFLTGTDEHGQKIVEAAAKQHQDPQTFVDGFVDSYKSMWHRYHISYDYFMRTTNRDHKRAVQVWLQTLLDTGDIYKDFYTGWYCTPCETFVTEKDNAEAVEQPVCPDCRRETTSVSEECYFFRLSKYQDQLLDFYEKNPHWITPKERLNEVVSFVKSGLKDLSVSRTTISWGIPFPGDDKHVTYVWADALNNYITAVGYGDSEKKDLFSSCWPADVQILGKDILRFHAVYWPAFLMASNLELPKQLLVHGWLKIDKEKMSKSRGNAVDPEKLATEYGVDEIRYYLLRKMAVTQDSEFSIADIEQSIHSELANDLGNLLHRFATLTEKYSCTRLVAPSEWNLDCQALERSIQEMIQETQTCIHQGFMHRAVSAIWESVNQVNSFVHQQEPWKQAKADPEKFLQTMSAVAHGLRAIATMLWPVMPKKMELLLSSIGVELVPGKDLITELQQPWRQEFVIEKIEPLFAKYDLKNKTLEGVEMLDDQKNQNNSAVDQQEQAAVAADKIEYIGIEDFIKVDLRAGTIIAAAVVEGSEKLLKLQVDFGALGKRQIFSGIRKQYTADQLIGLQGVFVVNLKPRKMMNELSEGMMLFAAGEANALNMLQPDRTCMNGARIQ
jgi:methionyl-tRNA synthetase